ncbi:hypothetical protein WAI453_004207 [Rhynchosporium graminicola]
MTASFKAFAQLSKSTASWMTGIYLRWLTAAAIAEDETWSCPIAMILPDLKMRNQVCHWA